MNEFKFIVHNDTFLNYERKEKISNIVIHETGGRTLDGAVATMLAGEVGAHFIIAPFNGDVHEYVNPIRRTDHAFGLNNRGIGIEIVNPYAPKNCGKHIDKYKTIDAQWWTWCPDKDNKKYVLPFSDQIKNCFYLIEYLTKTYNVPFLFPTIELRGKIPAADIKPGIVAHSDFGKHSDGRYILEMMYKYKIMADSGVVL